jgi:hypothetical protein
MTKKITPASQNNLTAENGLWERWNTLSFGGKFVAVIVAVNLLMAAVACGAASLRALGILPPAAPYVPDAPPPVYDQRQCWYRHVERDYGGKVSMDDLADDVQLQIRLECDPRAAAFDGQ